MPSADVRMLVPQVAARCRSAPRGDGRRRPGAADCLRERRRHAAGAGGGEAARDLGPAGHRRQPRPARPPAAGRGRRARPARRAGGGGGGLDRHPRAGRHPPAAAGPARPRHRPRLARARLCRRGGRGHRSAGQPAAGAQGLGAQPGDRSQGRGPARPRRPAPVRAPRRPGGRAGRLHCRAAGRRRAAAAQSRRVAARRRRLPGRGPGAALVRHRHGPLRAGSRPPLLGRGGRPCPQPAGRRVGGHASPSVPFEVNFNNAELQVDSKRYAEGQRGGSSRTPACRPATCGRSACG